MRFYEINPAVEPIARNLFTFVRDSRATVSFAEGDGRALLAAEAPHGFDVLVVDAFSGDAIPLHLLTVEAMAMYRRQLASGGVMAFHISNQYIDLEPVVANLARATGMEERVVRVEGDPAIEQWASWWVLVTPDGRFFEQPGVTGRVQRTVIPPGMRFGRMITRACCR